MQQVLLHLHNDAAGDVHSAALATRAPEICPLEGRGKQQCPPPLLLLLLLLLLKVVAMVILQGQVVKTFSSGKRTGGDFSAVWVSPRGEWIYCLGEDSKLYCFSVASGNLEHLMPVRRGPWHQPPKPPLPPPSLTLTLTRI